MLISALRIELYPAGFVGVQPLAHFGGASLPGTSFSFLVAVDAHEFRAGEDEHELPFRLCGDKGIRLTACSSFGNLCGSLLAQRNVQRQESTARRNFTAVPLREYVYVLSWPLGGDIPVRRCACSFCRK